MLDQMIKGKVRFFFIILGYETPIVKLKVAKVSEENILTI